MGATSLEVLSPPIYESTAPYTIGSQLLSAIGLYSAVSLVRGRGWARLVVQTARVRGPQSRSIYSEVGGLQRSR